MYLTQKSPIIYIYMSKLTQIVLQVGSEFKIPAEIARMTPEETEWMLSIGVQSLASAKRQWSELATRLEMATERAEMERVVFAEKEKVRFLREEQEMEVQKRVRQMREVYDGLLETYKNERDMMKQEKERGKDGVREEAMRLVRGELDAMRGILSEKEKQNEMSRETFERSMQKVDVLTQKRDVASIGKIGEGQFKGLAEIVFRDFAGFQMRDVHAVAGLGDFHLQFKEMTILVDSKLYSHKVPSTSRDKIKRDLMNNDHINFAWLVSMDTYVERYDKAPFMFEWVSATKCICYVNCLQKQADPGEMLRSVWYCCKAILHMMTTEEVERGNLSVLKEKELRMRDILSKLVKNNRERDTILVQMKANFVKSDAMVCEMLNDETNDLVGVYYRNVVEWWNRSIVVDEGGGVERIKSTALWTQFKRDMGDKLGEMDCGSFKEILCSFLGEDRVAKGKGKNAGLDVVGVAWKVAGEV